MECNIYTTVRRIGVSRRELVSVAAVTFEVCRKKNPVVSIHCIGEKRMRRLNRHYRGKDMPTDVLSFAMQEGEHVLDMSEWGDVFLCIPYVRRQAKRFGVSYKEELFRMLIHGILHLIGYDHVTKKDAKKMFSLQEKILMTCV